MIVVDMNVWNSQTIDLACLGEYLGLDLSGYTVYNSSRNDGKILITKDNSYDPVSRGQCSCVTSDYRVFQNGAITYREECSKGNSLRYLYSHEGDRQRFGDDFAECRISRGEFLDPREIDELKARILLAALGEETEREFYRAHHEEIDLLIDRLFPAG